MKGYRMYEPSAYAEHGLSEIFGAVAVIDVWGRAVKCLPKFEKVDYIKPKDATGKTTFAGVKFRYRQWGYMPQTKDYKITYQILRVYDN